MKKCFIISPIGAEGTDVRKNADSTMKYIIEPVCQEKDYEAVRADKISSNGIITQEIIQHLLSDELAIADLTGKNPNVFYELAIRHTMNLPTIQITRDDLGTIPFDVSSVRTIGYGLNVDEADKAREELRNTIDNINAGKAGSNPVNDIIRLLNLNMPNADVDSNSTMSELLVKVNGLPERLDQLENNIGIRFAQMFTAFAETLQTPTPISSEEQVRQKMLEMFISNILNDPQKGLSQIKTMIAAQELLEKKGLIKKGDN